MVRHVFRNVEHVAGAPSNILKSPVFVVGCPRSGTTLLYHMLLSAGGFAIYRAETHCYSVIGPKFGHLRSRNARDQFLAYWLSTKHFRLSGLDPRAFESLVQERCHSTGDFLRLFMDEIAHLQGVERWAECTPAHLLHIAQIRRDFPGSRIIHIIRDGRDVALSLARQEWIAGFPGDTNSRPLLAARFWDWMMRQGRLEGRRSLTDYLEIRFEELVLDPPAALNRIGTFIGQPLDYDSIRRNGIGSVKKPNTSFQADVANRFSPIGRWRYHLEPDEVRRLEQAAGASLIDLDYLPAMQSQGALTATRRLQRRTYDTLFSAKRWLKTSTPLGRRFVNLDALEG